MEDLIHSTGLHVLEHLWDDLGRYIATLSPLSNLIVELKQSLLSAWFSLPISDSENLVDSMKSWSRQCIQIKGKYVSY